MMSASDDAFWAGHDMPEGWAAQSSAPASVDDEPPSEVVNVWKEACRTWSLPESLAELLAREDFDGAIQALIAERFPTDDDKMLALFALGDALRNRGAAG